MVDGRATLHQILKDPSQRLGPVDVLLDRLAHHVVKDPFGGNAVLAVVGQDLGLHVDAAALGEEDEGADGLDDSRDWAAVLVSETELGLDLGKLEHREMAILGKVIEKGGMDLCIV